MVAPGQLVKVHNQGSDPREKEESRPNSHPWEQEQVESMQKSEYSITLLETGYSMSDSIGVTGYSGVMGIALELGIALE